MGGFYFIRQNELSILLCDVHTAFQRCLTGQAVCGLDPIRSVWMQTDIFPGEEAVHLTGVLTPGTRLYHKVGWLFSRSPVLRKLSQDRLVLRQRRVANKKLNEKWLVLTGFSILGGEGMPPPVVSVMRQGAVQHATVPLDIVMIEHDFPPAIVRRALLRVLLLSLFVSVESIKDRWDLCEITIWGCLSSSCSLTSIISLLHSHFK